MKKILAVILIILPLLFMGCSQQADTETLYQGSTIEALSAGNYDTVETVENIKSKGDTGLGTFSGLDGEMIILDGRVFKAESDGDVSEQNGKAGSPFYAVTYFDKDISSKFTDSGADYKVLQQFIDTVKARNDVPYAIVIEGKFNSIQVRSVGPYDKPYPSLDKAIEEQVVFNYLNLAGTLVGFWMPDYLGNANAAGYHLHFISEDLKKGGHLLELDLDEAIVILDETPNLDIAFSSYDTMNGDS